MARRLGGPDPKEAALAGARCLNPHPEQVTDPEFLASDFFDPRDAVQVKYEMVRKVKAGGAPVTEAAAASGYSRPAYYAAAAALESSGLEGLVPARPGPRAGVPARFRRADRQGRHRLAARPGQPDRPAAGAVRAPARRRPGSPARAPAPGSRRAHQRPGSRRARRIRPRPAP